MKTTTFFLALLCFPFLTNAQKTFTIRYTYKYCDQMTDSFMYKLIKPNSWLGMGETPFYSDQIAAFSKKDSICVTTCNYQVPDTSCGFINEGFGREIFIIPGDTMNVFITPLTEDSARAVLNGYWPIRLASFTYTGVNHYVYELFDSLQYFIGRDMRYLQNVPAASEESFKDYYHIVTDWYKSRVAFLNDYCARHNVQMSFKKLAFAEINSLWKSNLMVPTLEDKNKDNISTKFPDYYFKTIEEESFTDEELYFNTALYGYAVCDYWEYIAAKNDSMNLKVTSEVFAKMYGLVYNNCPDKMKEHLLGYLLKCFAAKGFDNYDSLLQHYTTMCKDKGLVSEVNAVAQKEKERRQKINEITLEKAEASVIEDQQGRTCTIKDLLSKKKFTVIDCWASWCGPCLKEIPYTRAIEQQYEKDFNFVFLSFDKNKNDWTAKMKELKNSNNSYLLVNGFKSDLAYHFGIASIPHYLIFDNNGNIVNKDASRPSRPQFKAILDNLLKEGKSVSKVSGKHNS